MKMKLVLMALGSVVVIAGWFLLIYRPNQTKVNETRQQVESTKAQVAALETELLRLQNLQRNEPQLRAELARFADALPTDPAMPQFILNVQEAAKLAKVDFLSITPSLPVADQAAAPAPAPAPAVSPAPSPSAPPAAGAPVAPVPAPTAGPVKSITVALTTNGGFFEVEDFIFRLERLDRAVRIDNFSVTASGDDDNPRLSVSLTMRMFTMVPPAAPAVPAPTAAAPTTETESA